MFTTSITLLKDLFNYSNFTINRSVDFAFNFSVGFIMYLADFRFKWILKKQSKNYP
jgi:hypothetical protein